MDNIRMNTLFEHIGMMDEKLVSMLENYKNYSEQKRPIICVLCSDNKLRAEVDKAFTVREDMYIDVIVTSEEVTDDVKYKALLSDVLLVCTRAKNIAPKGLYDLVKHISKINKQMYVILAGWESLERSKKMAKSRSERVAVEFEFARIMDVINVFSTPCEGFSTWDNVFNSLALHLSEKCKALHNDQDEKIYSYLLKYIGDFYTSARTEINKEIAILNNAERVVMAKQDYYGVRFSNLAVSVQNVVDSVRASIDDITYYDIVDDDKNETLTDIYARSGVEAQKYAKFFLIQEYKKRVNSLKDNSNEKVRIDNESCVAECINEMDALCFDISKLKYLPKYLVERLKTECEECSELEKIICRYETSTKTLIDNILERIPAKVGEYQYEMKYSVEVRDTGKDFLEMAKNAMRDFLLEGEDEDIKNEIQKGFGEDNDESLMLDRFQNDIEHLIFYSRNACGEMAQDCAKIIKQDMEMFAESILKIYFGSIIKEIQSMQTEMSKILEEYHLE